jgi:hypothetical protein
LSVQSSAGAPASLSRCSRRVFKASALALSWSVAPGSLATAANARSFRRTPSSDPISPLMRIVGDLNTAAKGPRWARRASYQDDQRRGPHRFREHGAPATSPVRSRTQTGPSAARARRGLAIAGVRKPAQLLTSAACLRTGCHSNQLEGVGEDRGGQTCRQSAAPPPRIRVHRTTPAVSERCDGSTARPQIRQKPVKNVLTWRCASVED